MRVYRPGYSKPFPKDAKVKRDKDGKYVIVKDREGQSKKARVTVTSKGKRITIPSSYYTIVFKDHTGIKLRLQGNRDRATTNIMAANIGRLVYHCEIGETLPAELQEWVDNLPDMMHQQLAGFGLVKARRAVVSQDMETMLEAFKQHLAVKRQRSERYVRETISKLRTMFDGCGFKTFTDIDDIVVDHYLLGLREQKNLSVRTLNGSLAHMVQFCKFAVRSLKVAKSNPLDCSEGFGDMAGDRRLVRRALRADEVQRLLTTTAASTEVRHGMDGPERAMVYHFTLTTGLRANEVRTLSVEHVDFDHQDGPVLYVDAAYSKHRERDTLPLHRRLVPHLKRFIVDRGRIGQAKLFGGAYQALTDKTADMIREDLVDADIPYETIAGVCDFHSLRHTYVSSLKGISARVAQGLARHKSSDMTDRYSHRSLAEQRAALETVDVFGMVG